MKPILFNGEMVQGILDDRKGVTRRLVKPQYKTITKDEKNRIPIAFWVDNKMWVKPPHQVGDVLYVRETFYYEEHMHKLTAGEPDLPNGLYSHRYIYRASSPDYPVNVGIGKGKWTPSIHMPKEAARIFIKVTGVSVERLQEITAEQCADEGIDIEGMDYGFEAVHEFSQLWDSTIKKADLVRYGWDANPFVWVIEFERCEKEDEEGK